MWCIRTHAHTHSATGRFGRRYRTTKKNSIRNLLRSFGVTATTAHTGSLTFWLGYITSVQFLPSLILFTVVSAARWREAFFIYFIYLFIFRQPFSAMFLFCSFYQPWLTSARPFIEKEKKKCFKFFFFFLFYCYSFGFGVQQRQQQETPHSQTVLLWWFWRSPAVILMDPSIPYFFLCFVFSSSSLRWFIQTFFTHHVVVLIYFSRRSESLDCQINTNPSSAEETRTPFFFCFLVFFFFFYKYFIYYMMMMMMMYLCFLAHARQKKKNKKKGISKTKGYTKQRG